MKLLLENWKRFLNEGIDPRIQKQLDALASLPEDIGILVTEGSSMGSGNIMTFHYVQILERNPVKTLSLMDDSTSYNDKTAFKAGIPWGEISIWKADKGECLNGWVVLQSGAERGWGPLLYEVALEKSGCRNTPSLPQTLKSMIATKEKPLISRAINGWTHLFPKCFIRTQLQ